jgi:hypothetical protein
VTVLFADIVETNHEATRGEKLKLLEKWLMLW